LAVPREYGIENMPVNGGSMTNRGYEATMGLTPIRSKDWTLNLSLNTSKNWNEVTKVAVGNVSWSTATSGNMYKEGYAVSSFWAFKCDGIDAETGEPIIDLTTEEGADTTDPTSFMVYAGKLDPDFTSGLGLSLRWKDLSISTSLYLQLGGKKFLSPAYESTMMPSEYENLSTELLNRWTPTNTSAEFPGLPNGTIANVQLPNGSYANVYQMYNYSDKRVVNASSLRCNSLALSYSFPYEWVKNNLHVKSLSLGASISNLFSIVSSDFHGRDAEVATGQQPRTRSVSLNLNVSF